MNMKNAFLVSLLAASVGQTAYASINCISKPNQNGGTASVTISENEEGQPTVLLFAQGGRAHFMTRQGPFVATAQHEPDGTFYTFEDYSGQTGTVAVITSAIDGKLQTTASANFGMWENTTMYCR